MGKPDYIDPGPRVSPPADYPSQLIHREHLDPLAAVKGFFLGFFAGLLLAFVLLIVL